MIATMAVLIALVAVAGAAVFAVAAWIFARRAADTDGAEFRAVSQVDGIDRTLAGQLRKGRRQGNASPVQGC